MLRFFKNQTDTISDPMGMTENIKIIIYFALGFVLLVILIQILKMVN